MKYIPFILVFFLISCKPITQRNNYPKEINSKELQIFYDVAKWEFYIAHLYEKCEFYDYMQVKDSPYLASLELRFDKLRQYHDSIEMSFHFYYDTIRLDAGSLHNFGILKSGIGFRDTSTQILYYLTENTVSRIGLDNKSNLMTNEKLFFIKNNIKILNPWFRDEAKKRKIVEF